MSPDYGLSIAENFKKYLQTGDAKHIEHYSARELKTAVSQLSPFYDHNKLWFRQIERRIDELAAKENRHRPVDLTWLTKWLQLLIAFIVGVTFGVMIQ